MFAARRERLVVALLCVAGAIRALIFSAAFPFFNNVDEALHFDNVMRYSRGHVPTAYDVLAPETVAEIARYASPEFTVSHTSYSNGHFPEPLWKQAAADADPTIAATAEAWSSVPNFELSQPPLYYALAGAWLAAVRSLGVHGLAALYAVRFFDALLVALLVWIGYAAARFSSEQNTTLVLGLPAFLAFFPQAIFFSIENDVLSPVVCGVAFVYALRAIRGSEFNVVAGVISGAAIAAMYLTKLSNLPMLAVVAIALVIAIARAKSRNVAAIIALVICSLLPIAAWMWWSKSHFGDVTGSAEKIAILGWQRKPLAEWLHHPIFSGRGLWEFSSDLLATYWRGELTWEGATLRTAAADVFYLVSSIVFGIAAVISVKRKDPNRWPLLLSAGCIAAAVVFLVLLSVQFDFGRSLYPSGDFPYFTSGRLIAGTLVPFALLYVWGIDRLFRRIDRRLPLVILAAIIAGVTASATVVNAPAFASEHNFFHR